MSMKNSNDTVGNPICDLTQLGRRVPPYCIMYQVHYTGTCVDVLTRAWHRPPYWFRWIQSTPFFMTRFSISRHSLRIFWQNYAVLEPIRAICLAHLIPWYDYGNNIIWRTDFEVAPYAPPSNLLLLFLSQVKTFLSAFCFKLCVSSHTVRCNLRPHKQQEAKL